MEYIAVLNNNLEYSLSEIGPYEKGFKMKILA